MILNSKRAANIIGFFWRRKNELNTLKRRFELREKTLIDEEELHTKRRDAQRAMRRAQADQEKMNEMLELAINSAWKQGSDVNGINYYYNYVTGETSWEAPDNMRAKVVDTWIRNVDAKSNVYYYNTRTQESSWLPPCSVCGESAERYCSDCEVSFCLKHFEPTHINTPLPDPSFADHIWSLIEYEKDVLKAGEQYCVECKTKKCARMCTTCWDGYCDVCFRHNHRVGSLRNHQYIPYSRAKKGWFAIKGVMKGERDYYVHGATGEVTYEKPVDLMTETEYMYFTNFQAHKTAAEKYIEKIAKLQTDLEAATYAKDMLLYDSLTREEKQEKKAKVISSSEIVDAAVKGTSTGSYGLLGSLFGSGKVKGTTDGDYRKKIASSNDRSRGSERTKYIEELLESSKDLAQGVNPVAIP